MNHAIFAPTKTQFFYLFQKGSTRQNKICIFYNISFSPQSYAQRIFQTFWRGLCAMDHEIATFSPFCNNWISILESSFLFFAFPSYFD